MNKFLILTGGALVAYISLFFALYAARVAELHPLFYSDTVIFYFPTTLLGFAFAISIWKSGFLKNSLVFRLLVTTLLVLVLIVISVLLSFTITFNVYGT
jgi:hypothetical protein